MTRSRMSRWTSSKPTKRSSEMRADAYSHHVLTLVLDGALYLAPIPKDIKVHCYRESRSTADFHRMRLISVQGLVSSGEPVAAK